jgi:hypothetical protein
MDGKQARLKNLKSYPRVNDSEPCAPKPVQVRIPLSQYEAWMNLSAEVRNSVLREAIAKKLQENHQTSV